MDVTDYARRRLQDTVSWAREVKQLRDELEPLIQAGGYQVHFRPASSGFSMVGLLPDRPQRGIGGLTNPGLVTREFERLYQQYCVNVDQGRPTGEKELQSYLIRESYAHQRRMDPINRAALVSGSPVELTFVTDEIPVPTPDSVHGILCDLLAFRRDQKLGNVPVLIELEHARNMKKLVEQVQTYSQLMALYQRDFEELYSALLGEEIRFDSSVEKWIVWPAAGAGPDRREAELAALGIRVVSHYSDLRIHVGQAPTSHLYP